MVERGTHNAKVEGPIPSAATAQKQPSLLSLLLSKRDLRFGVSAFSNSSQEFEIKGKK